MTRIEGSFEIVETLKISLNVNLKSSLLVHGELTQLG